ncbi:kinase-like domain-containing protein [Hyaloraphidium curvatum]|nr:kinase-like domain-containing protein [Hyaloraphidium curvatum]
MASGTVAEWFAACRNADIATVKRILGDASFDAGVRESGSKLTGLHIASSEKDDEAFIKELAELVAKRPTGKRDVNKVTPAGDTAFILAGKSGHFHSFKGLLDASVTQDGYKLRDSDGMSAWLLACRDGAGHYVDEMLKRFGWIDFNARDRDGMTGLALACSRGHYGVARAILSASLPDQYAIDCKLADNQGRTPFHWLCLRDRELQNGTEDYEMNVDLIVLFVREYHRTGAPEVDYGSLCSPRTGTVIERIRIYYGLGKERFRLKDPAKLTVLPSGLGAGTFGVVYNAKYNGEDVAVKIVRMGGQLTERRIQKEFNVWAELRDKANGDEPGYHNVLDVKGYFVEKDHWKIVSTVVPPERPGHAASDLHHWLWYHRRDAGYFKEALKVLQGAALGLAYIHRRNIIHGDIKAGNFLVANRVAKLIDFGMSRFRADEFSFSDLSTEDNNVRLGTAGFNGPELQEERKGRTNRRSDIFSFAMVAYEVASGAYEIWWNDRAENRQLRLNKGERPLAPDCEPPQKPPPNMPSDLWKLICRMWAQAPEDRPSSFEEVANEIGRIADSLR